MSSRFEERLRSGPPIVADGGMGALISGAVPRLRCPEEANLRAPESVVALHASFIRAGAELIETNTFGANRRKLAAHYLEDEFERINSSAVRLAREAREVSGADVFIAGSIGPIGDVERFHPAEQSQLFSEQAQILEGRGVDLLMLETFFDLDELVAAIEAVRSVSSLPIVALMTFDADGQTLGGVSAETAAERLDELDVAAAGANHSAGPAAALNALASMQRDGLVLAALPNVGLASLAGNRVVFPHATPDYFAEFAAQARRLGAGIIGGCCGTTPAQIEAIRAAIEEDRAPAAPLVVRERELADASEAAPEETGLARMLREQEFVVSVQLDPPLGANNAALVEAGRALRESGKAHFVDVNDNPRARARMSGVMASVAIERGVRHRDDPAPDDARHVGRRSRVAPARRARRGRAQHPRRHRRPARGRRLPGRARRLRGRRDRPDAADHEPEPGRGLPRPRRSTPPPRSSSASPSTRRPTTSSSSWSASSASSRPAPSSR